MSKKERDKERLEKLAKKISTVNLPRRIQPKRNAAAIAAAVISDYDSSDSDLDSRGSAASYDPEPELYYNVTDSDFYEGLVEEDKKTYRKVIRRKKMFLGKARNTTVPILQRNELHDRASQKCEIVRQQEGEGEGEGEGSSGNSRGLRNVAIPAPNAAIDPYAKEFRSIVEGTDLNHKYSNLSTQMKYHEIKFDLSTEKYKLTNAPNVDTENQNVDTGNLPLDLINEMRNLFVLRNIEVPDYIQAAIDTADKDTLLTDAINHEKWKDNTLPIFDVNKSYFSNKIYTSNNLSVDAPETFFNFFWPDENIEVIVKETNNYIDKKHNRNMQQNKK